MVKSKKVLEKVTTKISMKSSTTSTILRNLIPTKRPNVPPIVETKLKLVNFGI